MENLLSSKSNKAAEDFISAAALFLILVWILVDNNRIAVLIFLSCFQGIFILAL